MNSKRGARKAADAPLRIKRTKLEDVDLVEDDPTTVPVTNFENTVSFDDDQETTQNGMVLNIGEDKDVENEVEETEHQEQQGYGTRRHPVSKKAAAQTKTNVGLSAPLGLKKSRSIFSAYSFHDMDIAPKLSEIIESEDYMNLKVPTLVQNASIPVLLKGKDAMIKAETGSGKTLAYLIPIVQKLQSITPPITREGGTYSIILVPTRELCVQIEDVLKVLLKPYYYIIPTVICGGQKRKSEKSRLRKGSHIVITTPGRLLDHVLHTASFKVDNLCNIILDEADRLLDMGFEAQISQLMRILNGRVRDAGHAHPQTVLLSATLSPAITKLVQSTLRDYVFIDADKLLKQNPALNKKPELPAADQAETESDKKEDEDIFQMPEQLKQYYFNVQLGLQLPTLLAFLRKELRKTSKCKVLVFVNTCDSVEFLIELLHEYEWPGDGMDTQVCKGSVLGLHGNMPQYKRLENLRQFIKSDISTLICTDVAARGLDIPTVDWVVQYDAPTEVTEYVHRCGRTARAGETGQSIIFLDPSEEGFITLLTKHNLVINQMNYDMWFKDAVREPEGKGKFVFKTPFRACQDIQANINLLVEGEGSSVSGLQDLAAIGFSSYVRSYATYSKDLKTIFNVRQLHLGHVAKSFGLKTAPRKLGAKAVAKARKRLTGQIEAKGEGSKFLDFGTTSEKKKRLFEAIREEKQRKEQMESRKSIKKERTKIERAMVNRGKKRVREIMEISEFD